MSTIRLSQTTTLTPDQYIAGLTESGPGRSKVFGSSADDYLKIHDVGPAEADVTEDPGGVWERLHYDWSNPDRLRSPGGRDEQTDLVTRDAQLHAITRWGIPDPSKLARLQAITQPVLVANGDNDPMMITENSHLLAQYLPDAQLRIYPDAGHGFLGQYPEGFADHVTTFLDGR